MRLDGIATFVAVAETGSISEAARRLQLAKSVVSERLSGLEASLGARLVHRTTRKLALTEDGTAFLDRAARILRDIDEATAELAERRGELVGPLRISAPVTFGRMYLGPAIVPFLAKHPRIELTLDLDDRRIDVAASGFDAVVRHGPLGDSRLTAWRLAPSRRLLVASPVYLARHGLPKSAADLDGHRAIRYLNRGTADWRFAVDGSAVVVRGRTALQVNNGDVMRDAAIAGLGIALMPNFIVGAAMATGELVAIDIGMAAETEFVFIAHPQGRHPSAKLRAFAACLREAFGDPPYWDTSHA